ncbi:hypothetical protein [Ideonella sp. A 288]|uniref:hypothetical protein n=1 Tax=Ideonella sp. A 288 TaxID=1962181 RepID=UPI001F3FA1D2|nr:hypothetical protein [Ideonella sp. A 288]
MLWLERHGLDALRELNLPAPHVFEDIAPRPVVLPGAQPGRGLLTVRSGPDGGQLAAVHTPHIGGVLHVYRPEGERLTRQRLYADVSTHRIGMREVDLAAWVQGLLILPSQDGRRLRLMNPAADWTELKAVALPGRAILTAAVPDAAALAVLLDGGQVVLVGASARTAPRA